MNIEISQIVYQDSKVLDAKINIHQLYSTVPTNVPLAIVSRLPIMSLKSILDVGCGTGEFLVYLRKYGYPGELVGIDVTSGVFAGVDQKWAMGLCVGNAEVLPFSDNSFDVVTALHMLSHIDDLSKVSGEFKRVLKPNGYFVATANSLKSYPHVASYRRRIYERFGWGEAVFTTSVFNLENMKEILSTDWVVTMLILEGQLQIPLKAFMGYFNANIDVWHRRVTIAERQNILSLIDQWAQQDVIDGCIVEPKYVGVAFCDAR